MAMKTDKNLVLHIGIGKTGTTAIQKLLAVNRDLLLQNGFQVPFAGVQQNENTTLVHHHLARLAMDHFDKDVQNQYAALADEVKASKAHTILLSSEYYCFCRPSYVAAIAEWVGQQGYQPKIVLFVREQSALIESSFLQSKKNLFNQWGDGTLISYFKTTKNAWNFMNRVAPWVEHFGEQNIVVGVYDQRVYGDDVCRYFFDLVGVKQAIALSGSGRLNQSLHGAVVDLLFLIDRLGPEATQRAEIIRELLRLSEKLYATGKVSIMDEEIIEEIKETYHQSNAEFATRFLSGEHKEYMLRW